MGYLSGTAVDSDGNTYLIGLSDMRVFQGFYRTADGSLAFPNAEIMVPVKDREFWMSDENAAKAQCSCWAQAR